MTPEQQQAIDTLAGDNSRLSDFDRDALRALLEDCGRAEGLVDYWRGEFVKANIKVAANENMARDVAEKQRKLNEIRDLWPSSNL